MEYECVGAVRARRGPSLGALVGVGDQELGVGQLFPDAGQGDSKHAAWIPA